MVDEASTSYKCHKSFLPNLDALLAKDPFAVSLRQAEVKPSSIPLDGFNDGQSRLHYMVWDKEKNEEGKKKRSRGWSLKCNQVHDPLPSLFTSYARDLRHHITDKNLNFKEVLGWTKT
ncbi:unnamed protein product [Linum trigynum]|uniref:Uncharacterized protein n=1 Tax=Linum trigynum TaxID=586398 RepID=A0AAV2ED17_9ROSI